MLDYNRECFVSVKRLSDKKILEWTAEKNVVRNPDDTEDNATGMTLCKRKCTKVPAMRHPHTASENMTYTGMDNDDYVEFEPGKKPKKGCGPPGSGPSTARLLCTRTYQQTAHNWALQ